jgi:phage/plasmid primase-like uncharacterized protein
MNTNITERPNFKQQLINAIVEHGIKPPTELFDDGVLHRYSTSEDSGNKDGWYIFHNKGLPVAVFGCWRAGITSKWIGDSGRKYSRSEKEVLNEQVKLAMEFQKEALKSKSAEAKIRANRIWSNAAPAKPEHPYLVAKKINAHLARESESSLIIPLYQHGELSSLQFIDGHGEKRFLVGGIVSGSYCTLGEIDDARPICICEGYATGATIYEATNHPVVVAFNSGNLPKVAKSVREANPDAVIIIAGDDDFQNPANPGKKYATTAAELIRAKLIFPQRQEGSLHNQTDFNDMANSLGLFVVSMAFQALEDQDPLGVSKFSLKEFSLNGESESMRKKMLEDKYVLGRMAILGQFIVFYAAPNVGKTLLILWMIIRSINSGEIKASDIFYINADDNHKGLTFKLALAEEHGFHMLAPGYKQFDSAKLLLYIKTMIRDESCKGKVIVLDTLKKFVDIMRKDSSSEFGKIMREFVSHGGTVIGLGHVNKHKNPEGKSVFGGTSDITDDADCYYMIEEIQINHKSKTIRFENRKSRGDVDKTATFTYSNEKVSNYQNLLDSVQTLSDAEADAIAKNHELTARLTANKEVIDAIESEIKALNTNRTELINAVSRVTLTSKAKVKSILDLHTGLDYEKGHRWNFTVKERNCHHYFLVDKDGEMKYRKAM